MRTVIVVLAVLCLSATSAHASDTRLSDLWAQVERDEVSFTSADASAQRYIDAKDTAFAIRSLRSAVDVVRHQMEVLDSLIVAEQDLDRQTSALVRQGVARERLAKAVEMIALLHTHR